MVDDAEERAAVAAEMQRRLQAMGIRARIGRCDWLGLVAQGTAMGNRSYGAACPLAIDGRVERPFLICSARYGGITLVEPDWYAFDPEYIELFIRRACF